MLHKRIIVNRLGTPGLGLFMDDDDNEGGKVKVVKEKKEGIT